MVTNEGRLVIWQKSEVWPATRIEPIAPKLLVLYANY